AVVLTSAANCSGIDLTACNTALGAPNVDCRGSSLGSGVEVVNRGYRSLRFTFPDTDAAIGTASDDVTLGGPVKIAIGPVPVCELADESCSEQSGLFACIDTFYGKDGNCGQGTPLGSFPSFTALPPPNDYHTVCF